MTHQASKTCKVWIPLNPSVFSSGYFRITDGVFPLFSLFWILTNISQASFPLIYYCWMSFIVGCPSFYSVILGLSSVPLIPSICCPEYQNQCCVSNIGDQPLLYFLTISLFWGSLFKSSQLTFLFWGVLKGWPLIFLFPKLLDTTFSDLPFGCFSFCHFSWMVGFPSIKLKDP